MSWFQDDAVLVDERPRETVAEGVHLERRSLLRFSAATVAAGLAAACSAPTRRGSTEVLGLAPTPEAPRTDGTLDVAELLTEMHPRAKSFARSGGEREEAYLMTIGGLLARLETPTREETRSAMKEFRKRLKGEAYGMAVVRFDLEPGKGFSHHDHRNYNGVILCVEGEAHITNYDILGDTPVPPKGETFQIRQTRDDLILPGRFSSLGTKRDNVHELKAGPGGATVLDVFTFVAPFAKSYYMDVAPEPRDTALRIYDASWT
jgi:hypothetical protein